jgi:hypothetical protein
VFLNGVFFGGTGDFWSMGWFNAVKLEYNLKLLGHLGSSLVQPSPSIFSTKNAKNDIQTHQFTIPSPDQPPEPLQIRTPIHLSLTHFIISHFNYHK